MCDGDACVAGRTKAEEIHPCTGEATEREREEGEGEGEGERRGREREEGEGEGEGERRIGSKTTYEVLYPRSYRVRTDVHTRKYQHTRGTVPARPGMPVSYRTSHFLSARNIILMKKSKDEHSSTMLSKTPHSFNPSFLPFFLVSFSKEESQHATLHANHAPCTMHHATCDTRQA